MEFAYPPFGDDPHSLPEKWKLLPFFALPGNYNHLIHLWYNCKVVGWKCTRKPITRLTFVRLFSLLLSSLSLHIYISLIEGVHNVTEGMHLYVVLFA